MMAAVGLLCGTVGQDTISGRFRFAFGIRTLEDGLGLVPVIMGLFGISEVLLNLERRAQQREIFAPPTTGLLPTRDDWRASTAPILRGSALGFFLGILPGAGAIIASFAAYAVEKRASRHPERFGAGAIEGVAGPEAANNAAAGGAFIPLLTLGIPANAVMAILLGALMIHGLQPGPLLVKQAPDVFWGIITSMYVGNAMLLVLNLPLIAMWARFLRMPYALMYPFILLFCLIGAYSVSHNIGDGIVMWVFGVVGYLLKKFDYEAAPLILALVIGPMMEEALRQSLILSGGSFDIFVSRPITAAFLLAAVLLLLLPVFRRSADDRVSGSRPAMSGYAGVRSPARRAPVSPHGVDQRRDVRLGRRVVEDAGPQREPAAQRGLRQERLAAGLDLLHDRRVERSSAPSSPRRPAGT